ncbi:MAG TPA: error-prone DNA polymerase [Lichenihabitans sp.]|jgi:error-prone DNA polymerase|nr:error-prone DNA polymerase [Lichenihabitans sp.]
MDYAELQVTTNFSFLRGASHAEELFAAARLLGIAALGVVDRNSLAGIVRAHAAAKTTGMRLVVGCRIDLDDGTSVLVYPTDKPAYSRLCRLLTLGKGRAGKGACRLDWSDLVAHGDGLIAVLAPDAIDAKLADGISRLKRDFGDRGYLALTLRRRPGDAARLQTLAEHAASARVGAVATNDVLFHAPERRILQDVLTCIREGCTIDEAGFRKHRFADRHLKPPGEMARLFARHPAAIAATMEIARRCSFSLDELRYQYPNEVSEPGVTSQQDLERLTREGAASRFPGGVPAKTARLLRHELGLIETLGYAPYFLTVNAIVRFARSRNILCQGRGSAANSAVCYVLGITSIDPETSNLLFERFVSQERREPPDIDVDFEHDRREEVIQWIYDTYGRDRAALAATVTRYRSRGAVRDVGKALGLPEDITAMLAGQVWGWSMEGVPEKSVADLNLDPQDRRLRLTLDLSRQLIGFPRHLGQHPGGFVLTHDRLDDLVPIEPARMENRQVIEWDKDDIDSLRFMKVDVLGLGMLGCMRRAFDLLKEHKGLGLDLATIPAEDAATYRMIQRADTLGTFQIESRAQMAMLPRMKPKTFYDLVIEVAIVRPGPIQGDMVHPYLRRREGRETVVYPKPELEAVLGKTLGVPLFQEQAMRVAIECAGFTPGEADQLRRSMATFKFTGGVSKFRDKLLAGMVSNGYELDFAEQTFRQLEGFGSYGFPESHAASFALIAYASSWMKCHHPDVFCAALLNAQPMGFYAPAQIVRDARDHGVEVRPIDVNASRWDSTLEPIGQERFAVRLGLRLTKGLANAEGAKIVVARGDGPYADIEELWRRSGATVASLERLADADAFAGAMRLARRDALWAIRALRDDPLPLFEAADRGSTPQPEIVEAPVAIAPITAGGDVVQDYSSTGLTLRRHPVAFLREDLSRQRILPASALLETRDGRWLTVGGLVLVRQKPGSAKGVMFVTIEDETGVANVVVWPTLFERQRRIMLAAGMLAVHGKVQREGEVIHLVAQKLFDLTDLLRSVGDRDAAFPLPHGRGDEVRSGSGGGDRRDEVLGRKARDIYIPDLHIDSIKVKSRDFR